MANGTELLDRTEGAAIHPRFLRFGPWVLSLVVAALFAGAFGTSYAALYDYALELGFSHAFAVAFPLVLDAVIVVLAVALLMERALGRRTIELRGRRRTVRLPSWPLLTLWVYFAGSVAGNVGHAPALIEARFVAAVPPVSAAVTFHLLLRLFDRAATLHQIAEQYEEARVAEAERAAQRRARSSAARTSRAAAPATSSAGTNGHQNGAPVTVERATESAPATTAGRAKAAPKSNGGRGSQRAEAWAWYQARRAEDVEPHAPDLARHLGCSDGQARKLRAYCDERWAEEKRSGLHVVGSEQ